MKEYETISEMVTRFTDITNSLASLGKEYTQVEKFARSFVHSHQIGRRRQLQSKKKVFAFHTSSDIENSDDDKEEMAMLLRKFRKFLK